MSKWLRPLKVREYYLDSHFDSIKSADKWLYLAVVRGVARGVKGSSWAQSGSNSYQKMNTTTTTRLPYRPTLSCPSMT
jgi:hypothetical protein